MSKESLAAIVSRALTDQEYRTQLLSDPDAALADADLSEDEKKLIRGLNAEAFDELTMDLETRQSKSGFLGSLSLMGGKDAVDTGTVLSLLSNKYGGR